MKKEKVFDNLCSYDERNPSFADLYFPEDGDEKPTPRKNCFCDNCFYRRDILALEIIRLMEK